MIMACQILVRTAVSVVSQNDLQVAAHTYVITTGAVDQLADENWSFEDFLQAGKAEFINNYQVFGGLK